MLFSNSGLSLLIFDPSLPFLTWSLLSSPTFPCDKKNGKHGLVGALKEPKKPMNSSFELKKQLEFRISSSTRANPSYKM